MKCFKISLLHEENKKWISVYMFSQIKKSVYWYFGNIQSNEMIRTVKYLQVSIIDRATNVYPRGVEWFQIGILIHAKYVRSI